MSLHYARDASRLTPLTATDLTALTTTVSRITAERKDEFYSSSSDFSFSLATKQKSPESPKAISVLHNTDTLCKRTPVHVIVEQSDWVLRTDTDFVIPCSQIDQKQLSL